jgi:hypothetical protein
VKVVVQVGDKSEQEAELFVIGTCFGLEINKVTTRIALTLEQWKLVARSAKDRETGDYR